MNLSRQIMQRFRRVASSVLNLSPKHPHTDIHFRTTELGIVAYVLKHHAFVALPVGQSAEGPPQPLPFSAFDPKSTSDYVIESTGDGIEVTWQEGPIPKRMRYASQTTESDPLAESPVFATWHQASQRWTRVMAEATEVTDPGSMRYAFGCLQLDGAKQTIAATDGRQLYVAGGMDMPWQDAILVPANRYFLSREFTSASNVKVARYDDWFGIKLDDLVIGLRRNSTGRFPDVTRVVPQISAMETIVTIHPDDNRFLRATLNALPGGKEGQVPVTVDTSCKLAVRALDTSAEQATEIVLSRSRVKGPGIALSMQRGFLRQCLALELEQLYFKDQQSACVAMGEGRTYVWMPFSATAVVPGEAVTLRIDSETQPLAVHDRQHNQTRKSARQTRASLQALIDQAQQVITSMRELIPRTV